jgi:hypothetical protein
MIKVLLKNYNKINNNNINNSNNKNNSTEKKGNSGINKFSNNTFCKLPILTVSALVVKLLVISKYSIFNDSNKDTDYF